MHRLGTSALVAGTLMVAISPAQAGTPATNPNGAFIDLDVNVPPKASTKKKPVGMVVDFNSFTGNRLGDDTGQTSDIKVQFPAGAKFNGAKFPQCQLNLTDFSACGPDSQIGSGTAEGALTGPNGKPTFIQAGLKGYNGSPVDGKPTLIFIGTVNGNPSAELDFTVTNTPTGPVLDDYLAPGATPGAISITQFNFTTVDRKKKQGRKVTHLLTTPRSCPKAGWAFTQTNTYAFGTLAATSKSPCVRR